VQETILDYEVIKLHNFVVQSYNELLILDCASNRVRQQSSCANLVVLKKPNLIFLGFLFVT